jgi:predicted DNA-binding transcriptional regulator AlpA
VNAYGFVRLPVILNILGFGRSTFLDGVKDGRFPRPVKLGPRISAWRVGDIRRLIRSFDEPPQLDNA